MRLRDLPLPRVEATGFEPTTSASRTQRSTKLSHASIFTNRCNDVPVSKIILHESMGIVKRIFFAGELAFWLN